MKVYYQIDLTTADVLDEQDIEELESAISHTVSSILGSPPRVLVEYVDSEG